MKRKEGTARGNTEELENIVLSERSHHTRAKAMRSHLREVSKVVRFAGTESSMGVTRGWGRGNKLFNGDRVAVLRDEMSSGDGWC